MSVEDLAQRMGVSAAAVRSLEAGEMKSTVQLGTLRRAAEALECDLVHVVVPRESLDSRVRKQAAKQAQVHISRVRHSMRLEDQDPGESAFEALLQKETEARISAPGLWRA